MIQDIKQKGFSLIELMAVLAIAGILASIAYPAYVSQIRKVRRADAKIGLTQMAQQLERCFTQYDVYNSLNCSMVSAGPTVTATSPDGHYTITSNNGGEMLTASTYALYAIPVNGDPQTKDTSCTAVLPNGVSLPTGSFYLDNVGDKRPPSNTAPGCWE